MTGCLFSWVNCTVFVYNCMQERFLNGLIVRITSRKCAEKHIRTVWHFLALNTYCVWIASCRLTSPLLAQRPHYHLHLSLVCELIKRLLSRPFLNNVFNLLNCQIVWRCCNTSISMVLLLIVDLVFIYFDYIFLDQLKSWLI